MKLSIITINLNNHEGLRKTIDSVIGQTFRDFEWIVIDGGSTDGSKELIEQYADHFAYWVSEPDRGIYQAMNKGIKVAKGEYLQFLNSGDWLWNETVLQEVFSSNCHEDVLYGDCIEADGSNSAFPEKLDALFLYRGNINHQSSFLKATLFQDHLYSEEFKVASDWELLLSKVMFGSASYQKINVIVTGVQPGKSYDPSLTSLERETILNQVFSPMERAMFEHYASFIDNPMRPYYDYLRNFPKMEKQVRRMVRLHKKLKGN